MDLQPSGFLKTLIDSRSIRFQLRLVQGRPVIFEYVGRLRHPDFGLPLAEIVPEDEDQLSDLYSQGQVVIIGCDPLTEYGGTDILSRTAQE
jgi:hypothetical protein